MNVRAIYGCRQVDAGHEDLRKRYCYLHVEYPDFMFSNNNQF